jgi:xylulokinase
MDEHALAIDIGTTSIKCGLISLKNFKPVKIISKKSDIIYTRENWAEQDPEYLWQRVLELISQIKEESKYTISVLIFDAHMAGVVPVDKEGNALRNIIIWLDERASGLPRELFRGIIKLKGYSLFKLIKFLRITGGAPSKTGKDVLSKIIWMMENEKDVFSKTYKLLDVKGFLINKCTGKFVTSQDEASLTWLADTRKSNAFWSNSLLKDYKIKKDLLPEIKLSTEIAGYLKGEVSKILGNIPVFVGAGDLTASAVGSGAVKEGEPHIYVGTSDWVACHISRRKVDVFHYIGSILSAIPSKYLYVAEQEVASGAIEWAMEILGLERNYNEVENMVKRINESKLIFLPWLYGERSPIDDPIVRGGILNLSLETSKEEILKAVMEGVALNIKWIFPYVTKEKEEVNIVGGGALFDSWCQIIADALGLRIRRLEHPELTGVRGLAIIASVGMKVYSSFEEACSNISIERVFTPHEENFIKMNKKFKEFVRIYKKLRKTYKILNVSNI